MHISPEHHKRLEEFLDRVQKETYPEPISGIHDDITGQMLPKVVEFAKLQPGAAVLDIGCGQGLALERFTKLGFSPIGLTINQTDIDACRTQGFDVRAMDQSLLDFDDASFELIWCRHCLEHSIFPYYTLSQFYRVLKPGGVLYVEVPAPDTSCQHQTNPNHYSVLGKSLWMELMRRNGLELVDSLDITFNVPAGPDVYWAFIARRNA